MLVGIYAAVAHTNVRANLFNPRPIRTSMRREAFPGEDPARQTRPEAHAETVIRLALPSCSLNGEWISGDEALKA
jgi:NAD(P)-dependent dehydrogenase (short-subunit alcohol dehydrogenase family)